jgi:acetolactate synthase-1/2/3 large subunit
VTPFHQNFKYLNRSEDMTLRHGGKILVDQLKIQGINRVFCVPGESYLAALDGLYDSSIETVICRQEGGAAIMAEAHGKLTGKPGIAFVTRGPGATNASAGVHIAFQDSTPMILFIGQVARDQRDREAFQEVDYRQMFGPLAKWVGEVDQTERLPEYISHAFHVATSGRPGPVIISLPEDMLSASVVVEDAREATPVESAPSPVLAAQIADHLKSSERPMVIVGGGGWSQEAALNLETFAEKFDLPVGASFRCQDYLDNRHPNYIGDIGIGINPKLADRVRDADLLLVLGARLGEMTTSGYKLVNIPNPTQKLIHVYPDSSELGRVYRPDIAICEKPASLVSELAKLDGPKNPVWKEATNSARQDYESWQKPEETPGDVKLEQIIKWLSEELPEDAILTNGAGNYSAWLHRYFQYKVWRTQLAPTSGSMGYGLPAAIAAKIQSPEKTVVCLAGDGCIQMHIQEFATAVQYGANIIIVVSNNSMYGTIRMHQERHYPGRVSGTDLVNPNFADLARAYGGHGDTVTSTEQFAGAFSRADKSGKPSIIELKIDQEALSPRLRLTA